MNTNSRNVQTAWLLALVCFGVFSITLQVRGADHPDINSDNLFDMSIEQLMNVEIALPATITERNPLKTPASVTVITAEDIARTPARNLLDLLEVYVPGFLYLNHSVGPLPGMRGVLVDRPHQYLVNVNGINVNIKAQYGARLELLNWDLNDIDHVEIIRGPGSVTYGPGAVGGVINIYTKTAVQDEGFRVGGRFWDKYDSIGNYVSFGEANESFNLFTYFSVVHTTGHTPDLFGVGSPGAGYVGHEVSPGEEPPFTYLADFYNEPQVKAHVDVLFRNNWRFWARYVTANSALIQGSAIKYPVGPGGAYEDFRQTRFRYWQLVLENKLPLDEEWELKSQFGVSSIDVLNVEKYTSALGAANDRDNLLNIGWTWSEDEYFARFMMNYKPVESRVKAAFGFEAGYDIVGPAWGKGPDSGLRLSDGIISGPGSDAYGPNSSLRQVDESNAKYFAVGDGWETTRYAFLGEFNYQITPKLTSILSARLDKHSYTDFLFSPRAALVYEVDPHQYLKFIVQRSTRMNTQEELFMNHKLGEDNDPEKLDTIELIWSKRLSDALTFQTSAFYNRQEIIGWDWVSRSSAQVGTLKAAGIELEALYKKDNFDLGINHAFVKQLDFKRGDNMLATGISYSDYFNDAGGGAIITSKGNDLNNWSNNISKLFTNIRFGDGKFTLHGDLRALWGFEGYRDGLRALEAGGGDADDILAIRDHDAFDFEITANVSLTWHVSESADLTVFVHSIPVLGDNKRYSYSSGFKRAYPDKVSWIEEPTVVGLQYHLRF